MISPNSPKLETTPSEDTGAIGDTLTDSATLSGATAGAGTSIDFYLFAPSDDCTDLTTAVYSATGVPVSGNGTYFSADATAETGSNTTTGTGTYHWLATYTGDANNADATSACADEPVVISPNSPKLETTPSEDTGAIGDTLTDSATLSGATAGAGTSIDFYLFAPSDDCTDLTTAVYSATGVPVNGNGTYISTDATAETGSNITTGTGTYHWLATYTGDANNADATSACADEPVVISPNSPKLETTPSEDTGAIGDTLTDSATLSGATAGAGTSIDFYLFAPTDDCTDITTAVYSATGVPVNGNGTYSSTDATAETGSNITTGTGTYHWLATYTGDANNADATSACADEPVVISPNSPKLETTPSEDTAIGDTLTDSATLSGATAGAGARSASTCSRRRQLHGLGTAVYSATGVPVTATAPTSAPTAPTETGSNATTGRASTTGWPSTRATTTTTRRRAPARRGRA